MSAHKFTLAVTYPPDYDGELHVSCEYTERGIKYEFTRAPLLQDRLPPGQTSPVLARHAWDQLVLTAREILAQEDRRVNHLRVLRAEAKRPEPEPEPDPGETAERAARRDEMLAQIRADFTCGPTEK